MAQQISNIYEETSRAQAGPIKETIKKYNLDPRTILPAEALDEEFMRELYPEIFAQKDLEVNDYAAQYLNNSNIQEQQQLELMQQYVQGFQQMMQNPFTSTFSYLNQ